jgi:hypothetical protein
VLTINSDIKDVRFNKALLIAEALIFYVLENITVISLSQLIIYIILEILSLPE